MSDNGNMPDLSVTKTYTPDSPEREFKGIWIPANIWLSDGLTIQEKVMLAEIASLDGPHGCYASNQYFATFFQLSKDRVRKIIAELNKKNLITLHLERDEKGQIIKRILKVNPTGWI